MNLGRFMRTVRRLKPEQVWGRAAHLIPRGRPDLRPAPRRRAPTAAWVTAAPKAAAFTPPATLRFLNEAGDVVRPQDWQGGHDLLWLYNLHYFDDLASSEALAAPAPRVALIDRWLSENPPAAGIGWAPYPTSLRIVNWIKAQLAGFPLPAAAAESLAVQARWLAGRLERHLLGNHLLANAKALVFAGCWFEGAEADGWRRRGLALLAEQLPEQILPDGGHFERSPMYHAIIEEDLLDLLNLARAFGMADEPVLRDLPGRIAAMRAWLAAMTHPDGRISFFNDAAFGIAAEPDELEAYAARLRLPAVQQPTEPVAALRPSGYLRLRLGEAVALIDAAPIGPDYLPGHAHADTLSFELSIGAARVIVNGGTSVYGDGPQRQLERATASHSTVEIDGENSSEVWAGFRVGRRARVRDLTVEASEDEVSVSAAHDGYRWRRGRPIHRRRWTLTRSSLTVRDEVDGAVRAAIARFHFAPQVEATAEPGGRRGVLVLPDGRRVAWTSSAPARIEADEWRPEFGLRTPSHQLAARLDGAALETRFDW
ncbi:alginate lyase family protein [Phenylobacterium sp.]|uniref:heparinase II/III family protein n=1 Tax=Phenylobacterium sp. TaxID=1871053 RepID=UPI002DECC11D|nr:alginate lyase family protein [Phenylobacterium sp.]